MQLLNDETAIADLSGIQITSLRIIHEHDDEITVIPLTQFSTARAAHVSYPSLLGIAGLFIILSLFVMSQSTKDEVLGSGIIGIGLSIIFVASYFITRGFRLEIYASSGEKISVKATGIGKSKMIEFINMIRQ